VVDTIFPTSKKDLRVTLEVVLVVVVCIISTCALADTSVLVANSSTLRRFPCGFLVSVVFFIMVIDTAVFVAVSASRVSSSSWES
jgi:hypothetical protein